MENIFLESYDVFKLYPNSSGKVFNEFLNNNKKYHITRCYYSIMIENTFLTYSHLMIYETLLYMLFSQNKLKNRDFTFKIKKSDLVKKFKTNITKTGVDTIKRFHELKDVKITIFVKDKIQDEMSIIDYISISKLQKYGDIPDEVEIKLNSTFLNLYQCAYLDKIEYLNSFSEEKGSFVRYFMQHQLNGGTRIEAIVDKMGIMDYIPLSRKKKFKDEISNLNFYYKNEKHIAKDGFVVLENTQGKIYQNQNAFIYLFGIINQELNQNLSKKITLNNENLKPYFERFGKFQSCDILFKMLNNMELLLNKSVNFDTNNNEVICFSHFFESIVFVNKQDFKICINLTQKGFEYILSKKANLDLWDVESKDYGLTLYPSEENCKI
ncbi:hypothetical protein CSPB12327_04695 [Campylobacter sp. RM12327]|uniref:hypothetical protein n=1 Tax=Campylobacter sputorum TaxID=206 RepID=UPI000B787F45|nr:MULTISPECIES: hypothetical protein [Campylobacter]ASM40055.1 hypothetical protein CSPB_0831 [Campylobacter sputorum]MBE7358186.1 hypothetical protein [Campylobacter sp. RM11302]MBF6669440.1 hypothetical protein [Campylobacter sp. RM12327]MBF6674445.1 hypothetical protein [Campylobacter sp. RM13538]MBF6676195.1 hypothetical protein [Campylobacter sp. RM12321]